MVEHFHTGNGNSGMRLDQFLQLRAQSLSRTKIRKIIELGGVHIDGQRIRKCGYQIGEGQKIELHQDKGSLEPYRIQPDDVLFQDEYIIVLNKPPGIETQPTPARYKGTLYEALQVHLGNNPRQKKTQIGMVQRLDRDTSGVLVFSIHKDAHKKLGEQVQNHAMKKEYLAFVQGIPEDREGTFHSFLGYDKNSHRMKSVVAGGKEAITHYQVVETWRESSLVRVQLVTGRTHQIRAHFAEAGHPILGDTLYGGPTFHEGARWSRQCLHAWKLQFAHPKTGTQLSFTAPAPADMAAARLIETQQTKQK